MLKDLARAVSLANLCFIAVWSRLITKSTNPKAQYWRYSLEGCWAIFINVLMLAAIFWVAMILVRRSGSALALKIARAIFLLTLLIPINGIIHTEFPRYAVDDPAVIFRSTARILATIAIILLVAYLIKRFGDRIIKIAATAILLMLPFALLTFGQAALQLARFSDKSPAAPASVTRAATPRVVWMVFDEVDQRIAFATRPPSLKMPEIDRLRGESIYATNAYPPAGQTLLSLPALITGRYVSSADAVNPSELRIKFEDSEQPVGWSAQPNIFSSARELGAKTALMGWYHPYCRIIGENLDTCTFYDVRKRSLSAVLFNQLRTLVNTVPFVSKLDMVNNSSFGLLTRTDEGHKRNRLDIYLSMLEQAKRLATDPSHGLVFIHWSFPHKPNIYDRTSQDFRLGKKLSYLDNLALVDRTVGELRREMESAGVWEETILLITSDHSLRGKNPSAKFPHVSSEDAAVIGNKPDPRVPFLLKLRGQPQAVTCETAFNTVITSDLLLALMRGELASADSVIGWLEEHRSTEEGPHKRKQR